MRTSTIVFDGLWQCLCPSFSAPSLALISRLPRPKPNTPRACARTIHPQAACAAQALPRSRQYSAAAATSPPSQPQNFNPSPHGPRIFRNPSRRWADFPLEDRSNEEIYERLRYNASQGHTTDTRKLAEFLVVERNERPNNRLFSALILANVDPVEGSAADVGALLSELRAEGLEPDAGVCHDALKVGTILFLGIEAWADPCRRLRSTQTTFSAARSSISCGSAGSRSLPAATTT